MKQLWELMDEYIESYWENNPISVEGLLSQCSSDKERKDLEEEVKEWTAAQEGMKKNRKNIFPRKGSVVSYSTTIKLNELKSEDIKKGPSSIF
jgi:hypothetical protein